MKPQAKPRIVSKSRYLGYLSRTKRLSGSGTFLIMLGAVGTFGSFLVLVAFLFSWVGDLAFDLGTLICLIFSGVLFCLLAGIMLLLAARSGLKKWEQASRLEPVVPLTRHSADQLPAEESLVRASSEPSDVQPQVLLRAGGSDLQTAPKELMRASHAESDDAP